MPAVWLFEDPEKLFLAIRVTNALLAASVLPLLYLFCRRVLARPPWPALVASACGALVPPLIAHSASILAENLVLPLAVATVLACWCTLTPRPGWQRLWFAPAMVLLYVTHHNRFALAVGRHMGTGSPWPDKRSGGIEGSVRLTAVARDPEGREAPTLVGSSPLPRWLRPGDRFVTSLELTARDAAGRPLRPGRYEVGIDLEQVGFGSFVEPGQERGGLVMSVR